MYIVRHTISYIVRHRYGTYTQHGFTRRTYIYIYFKFFLYNFYKFFFKVYVHSPSHHIVHGPTPTRDLHATKRVLTSQSWNETKMWENQMWAYARFSHRVAHGRDSHRKEKRELQMINFTRVTFATRASPRTKRHRGECVTLLLSPAHRLQLGRPRGPNESPLTGTGFEPGTHSTADHTLTNRPDESWKFGKKSGINSSVPKHC